MKNLDSINRETKNTYITPTVSTTTGNSGQKTVNLIGKAPQKKPRRWLKFTVGIILLIIVILSGLVISKATILSSKIFVGQKTTFLQKVKDLIGSQTGTTPPLVGEDVGQINILLLGIGGEGHDGPYLTDTMMVAQIRPDINQIVLTAIPRDYLATIPKIGDRKINAAFAEGYYETKDWDKAGLWARQAAEKVSGLTIPYFAVVDFSGFEKAVDEIGGVDVVIDRTFTDYTYPDSGVGYLPPQTFTAGPIHLDGKHSLIFARSRHAAGPEGSDFARGQRQQKIIQAFKSKLIGLNIISDANKVNGLLNVFADHFHTNMSPSDLMRIYNLVKNHNIQNFISLSLDPDTGLICPQILESNGAYVLEPCPGKTTLDIQNFFKNAFINGKLQSEKSVVWMAASDKNQATYKAAAKKLTNAGITVWPITYSKGSLDQTIVYQVNSKPATAEFIKNSLGAIEATMSPPGMTLDKGKLDIVVILGKTAEITKSTSTKP